MYGLALRAVVLVAIIVLFAVCLHSVEEIHYLKTFYPDEFTVEQAFYASGVELIKITLIGFPTLVLIAFAFFLMREARRKG